MTETGQSAVRLPEIPADRRRRALLAASIGNVVEWFDFAIYGYLAVTIGAVFFPASDPTASLLSAFAVFAVAFGVRPLGGIVFGPLSDRIGRQRTLAVVIVMMSAATLAVGLLPGHATAGVAAPALLVVARLVQGLSAGGEVGNSATYLAELAPQGRRGITTSWVEFSTLVGLFLGSASVLLLQAVLTDAQLVGWGWRLPFLLGGVLGAVGLYIRLRLDETPYFEALRAEPSASRPSVGRLVGGNVPQILKVGGITVMQWVAFYLVLTYLQTLETGVLGLPAWQASVSTLATLAVTAALVPLSGRLSDRVGRRPVLMASAGAFVVLSYPVFLVMTSGGFATAVACHLVLGVLLAPFLGTTFAALTELFPTGVRTTGFAIGYNVTGALFGGTAPYLATALVAATQNPLLPAVMLAGSAAVTLLTLWLAVEETGFTPLRQD